MLLLVPRGRVGLERGAVFRVFSGVVGTAMGRLFRVVSIEKVGAPVAAAILNLTTLIATIMAIAILGERVTGPILGGTLGHRRRHRAASH